MVVWVTGADGFIGSALVRKLSGAGIKTLTSNFDIRDQAAIRQFVEGQTFDAIVHLAGISSVKGSEVDKARAFAVNSEAVFHLGEAISELQPRAHFVFPSTSHVYAVQSPGTLEEIYSEDSPILPRNFYALTKALAEDSLRFLAKNNDLKVTILRLFNHTHKSQSVDFFLPSVYSQLLEAKQRGENRTVLTVGDIDVNRDLGVIQDLTDAFQVVLQSNTVEREPSEASIFNVSSGRGTNLKTLADTLASKMGLELEFQIDTSRLRKNEPKSIIGKNLKFCETFRWAPLRSQNSNILIESFLKDIG